MSSQDVPLSGCRCCNQTAPHHQLRQRDASRITAGLVGTAEAGRRDDQLGTARGARHEGPDGTGRGHWQPVEALAPPHRQDTPDPRIE
jgi:hypothetical protein